MLACTEKCASLKRNRRETSGCRVKSNKGQTEEGGEIIQCCKHRAEGGEKRGRTEEVLMS